MADEAAAKKLLARKKMRNILMKSAMQDETDAIEREQSFLQGLVDAAKSGDIDALSKTLSDKIDKLEQRCAGFKTDCLKSLLTFDDVGCSRKPANRIEKAEPALKLTGLEKDETNLQSLLKKYAKGQLTHQGLCQADYWEAFAEGLHITNPDPSKSTKPVRGLLSAITHESLTRCTL
jgi:hypothetical protein